MTKNEAEEFAPQIQKDMETSLNEIQKKYGLSGMVAIAIIPIDGNEEHNGGYGYPGVINASLKNLTQIIEKLKHLVMIQGIKEVVRNDDFNNMVDLLRDGES